MKLAAAAGPSTLADSGLRNARRRAHLAQPQGPRAQGRTRVRRPPHGRPRGAAAVGVDVDALDAALGVVGGAEHRGAGAGSRCTGSVVPRPSEWRTISIAAPASVACVRPALNTTQTSSGPTRSAVGNAV